MISNDSLLHAEVAAQGSARLPAVQLVATRHGLRDAVERQLPEAPDLVIFDASDVEPAEGELVERLSRNYPAASFMLLTRAPQHDLLIRAMRAGMREVLTTDVDKQTGLVTFAVTLPDSALARHTAERILAVAGRTFVDVMRSQATDAREAGKAQVDSTLRQLRAKSLRYAVVCRVHVGAVKVWVRATWLRCQRM
jgi:DNA-binding NarL/FixJ family response regulator